MEQGDGVIAIGSPYNFDFSVTFGIISATGRGSRTGEGIGNYVPYIQTDAAVNRGNSGGPLFNLEGEVIGINSQIYSRSGGNEGLAFAIPMNVAMEVVEQLKESGIVSRGYLGVQGGEVSSDLAEALGMNKPIGALVRAVVKGEAADSGGIKPGDVIVELDGNEIVYFHDLQHTVGRIKPGKTVRVKIFRDGKYVTQTIKIGVLPMTQTEVKPVDTKTETTYPLGIMLGELSDERTRSSTEEGVRVLQVMPNSPAYGVIFRGDIITKIKSGNTSFDINSIQDFESSLESFDTGDIILIIGTREGANIFEPVEVE